MRKTCPEHPCGAFALIVVLALVAVMTMLAVIFFISVTGESRASRSQSDATKARQLAASAAQMVMAQIQAASTQPPAGADNAGAWVSQPGLIRTFTPSGASTAYKLYSGTNMVTNNYAENEDAPPATWRASPSLYCDINAPVQLSGTTVPLAYPVADPSVAATSGNLTMSGSSAVPGFALTLNAVPGYSSGTAISPTNNPLPMPVRWLYILKDGQIATPETTSANGSVSFVAACANPSPDNPVVGRVAFWADDETCKVNINTAGYAKNDTSYWTYWDTPVIPTQDEDKWLSSAQPWTNEFQRYPGHPATTALNVVFDSLNLTPAQVLALTPFYKDGGTSGGTLAFTSPPTSAQIQGLLKNDRLFPTVDEMFYTPSRGAQAAGIQSADLEARRFLLTATSRAPETTLFDTPRVTIWPTWQTADKRTSIDRLIAFCSTIAPNGASPQPFYFVRENPLSTTELTGIAQNQDLWTYLQTLSGRTEPGFGASFRGKFGNQSSDQILTSIWDAIRLTNIDDRTPPASGNTGYSYTTGTLAYNVGTRRWTPTGSNYNAGFIAPTDGPNGTRGAGRAAALHEVTFLFARTSSSNSTITPARDLDGDGLPDLLCDNVKAAVLYNFWTPSAGMVQPGQRRSIVVEGLSNFRVRLAGDATWQQLFSIDRYEKTEIDPPSSRVRYMGGRVEHTLSVVFNPTDSFPDTIGGSSFTFGPPTANVTLRNSSLSPMEFSGGNLTVKVYYPEKRSGDDTTNLYQTYQLSFPTAQALSPLYQPSTAAWWNNGNGGNSGRWGQEVIPGYEFRNTAGGDTTLSLQNHSGDYRSEVLRRGTIADFRPHARYGSTSVVSAPAFWTPGISRQASCLGSPGIGNGSVLTDCTAGNDLLYGRLVKGFNRWHPLQPPCIPCYSGQRSIEEDFPPGDFSNGPGIAGDGSLSPKTDEGMDPGTTLYSGCSPYFRNIFQISSDDWVTMGTLASPNRQMPSAVLFGSIPTGTGDLNSPPSVPWRTLLFHPARAYHMGGTSHFGATSPPDYLMLDWFHMPIVEPYAISEPFSTAGKVNLNAMIIPFGGYVRRETALYAVLRSARISAIPEATFLSDGIQVGGTASSAAPSVKTRYAIDEPETLSLLRQRFDGSDGSGRFAYLTAGEVCSVDLVPQGFTGSNLSTFWSDKRTTGDNLREQPYSSLVPRLTARSNSFTVHVTAQALAPGPGAFDWLEGRGKVLAEWRGAITVERYVDPSDERFSSPGAPNFLSGTQSVGPYYKFRVLGTRRFNP